MPYKDKAKRKAHELEIRERLLSYYKKYDDEHKEQKKAYRAKHYAENKEFMLARGRKWRSENKELMAILHKNNSRSLKGRHKTLKVALIRDDTPQTDLLWRENFYGALIQDAECHYCSRPLNETGGGLDRMDNSIGHTCYNVVPCCRLCNRTKAHDILYEEMKVLAPALKQVRFLMLARQEKFLQEHAG